MWNQPIQLSNDVTVTLFLNQFSQNFEQCLEMIINTSVQNFIRIQCFILQWKTHSLNGTFDKSGPQNQQWRNCDVISQLISTKFCILVCYAKISAKLNKKQRSFKKWETMSLWLLSKNSSAIFCVWVFFTRTYLCTKFQVDWRSDKGITGGGTKHPPAENDQKSPSRIGLNLWTILQPSFIFESIKVMQGDIRCRNHQFSEKYLIFLSISVHK